MQREQQAPRITFLLSIVTGGEAETNQLIDDIVQVFPKLAGIQFELLRAVGAGQRKPLTRISTSEPVPNVLYLKSSVVAIIYIRPRTRIELVSLIIIFNFMSIR